MSITQITLCSYAFVIVYSHCSKWAHRYTRFASYAEVCRNVHQACSSILDYCFDWTDIRAWWFFTLETESRNIQHFFLFHSDSYTRIERFESSFLDIRAHRNTRHASRAVFHVHDQFFARRQCHLSDMKEVPYPSYSSKIFRYGKRKIGLEQTHGSLDRSIWAPVKMSRNLFSARVSLLTHLSSGGDSCTMLCALARYPPLMGGMIAT